MIIITEGIHSLLEPNWKKGVDFVDLSVPRAHPVSVDDDLELMSEIRDRIRQSDVLLVLAGKYASFSEWVKAETILSVGDGCPIIAVAPNGAGALSVTATRFACKTVRWRGDSLREAILSVLRPEKRETFQAELLKRTSFASELALASIRVRYPYHQTTTQFGQPRRAGDRAKKPIHETSSCGFVGEKR